MMQRISYEEVEDNEAFILKEAIFKSEDLADRTYQGILDKYESYRFEEHIEGIREEFNCQSYSDIVFKIRYEKESKYLPKHPLVNFIHIFSAVLEIPNRDEMEYSVNRIIDMPHNIARINEFIEIGYYKNVYIEAVMQTKFYIQRGFDLEDVEEEDEGFSNDVETPPAVESSWPSENCSICLEAKPNILNLPCLHLCVCANCESVGKLKICSICRETIQRKIKI